MLIRLSLLALLCLAPSALSQTATELVAEAQTAYQASDPVTCALLYGQAFEREAGTSRSYYDAACCAALAGQNAAAFDYLHRAVAAGYRDADWLERDSDLASLRGRPEWPGVMAAAQSAHETFLASLNLDLYAIYQADQADRQTRPIDWSQVSRRDSLRRVAVGTMLLSGQVVTADDYYHAAMVYQHGDSPESFLLANLLTTQAVLLDPSHEPARQMMGMTHDRYLWNTGRPQVYGTQFKTDEEGYWTFEPFDPDAVTDEERAAVGSLPLAAKYEWLDKRNAALRAERAAESQTP